MDLNTISNLNRGMENAPIDSIYPHPMNPNRGNVHAISESIDEIGWFGATLIQKSTRRIIAGEHRWKALKSKNAENIDVILLDCDDSTALKILLADNEFARLSRSDNQKLGEALLKIQKESGSIKGLGISDIRAESLLSAVRSNPLSLEIERPQAGTEGAPDPERVSSAVLDAISHQPAVHQAPESDIRQIMLFVPGSKHAEMLSMLKALKAHFPEARNNSEVIVEAIKFAFNAKGQP